MTDGKDISQVADIEVLKNFIEALKPAIDATIEVLKKFVENLRPLIKYQMNQNNYIRMMMSEEYQTAAKHYPKLNYLALRAKKRRVRIKKHQTAVQNRLFN